MAGELDVGQVNYLGKYVIVSKYLLLLIPALGTLLELPNSDYPFFTVLMLAAVVNSQLRNSFRPELLSTASILLETLFIVYLNTRFGGFCYLILFSSLTDSFLKLNEQVYLVFFVGAIELLYSLQRFSAWELTGIVSLLYLTSFLLLLQLRREALSRADTELLYDQIRTNNYELEGARLRLLDYSRQIERMTQLEERQRISRELHDSLGHSLAGILIQVDAARQVMGVNREKGMEIISSAHGNINKCIETVRQTVHNMHPVNYPVQGKHIEELIGKFQHDTGIQVHLTVNGTPFPLLPSMEIAAYENTREALTNALRHGKAQNILVKLDYLEARLEILIRDDGPGAVNFNPGFGLKGMMERLDLIGGEVSFNGNNGFSVAMRIPRKEV